MCNVTSTIFTNTFGTFCHVVNDYFHQNCPNFPGSIHDHLRFAKCIPVCTFIEVLWHFSLTKVSYKLWNLFQRRLIKDNQIG